MVDVILVNERDEQISTMEKMLVHERGLLHRAFSVVLYNATGEMLIHKRAADKHHCPGMWTNACCSHPKPDENTLCAASRRLEEELGYTRVPLKHVFSFLYKAQFENSLIEHEYDHVFIGHTAKDPVINLAEIAEYKWMRMDKLRADIGARPSAYTPWFRILIEKLPNENVK